MKKRCFLLVIIPVVLSLFGCSKEHSHGYDFDNPNWVWTSVEGEAGYAATVTLTCTGCDEQVDGHYLTLNASVSHATVNPTCLADGSITYTATATYEGKTLTDYKVDSIQKLGHSFDTITVEGDYKKNYVALESFDASNLVVKGICSREECG